jgi:D-beta-D-heptose 7-phosphate kinase/D-beta-D-heptose 1-phosphate adenosyltransferase
MTQTEHLARHLPAIARVRAVVLGDVMLDRYVEGEVRRISPEAPIPVLRAGRRRGVAGGAANVAKNIAALGAGCVLIGLVGADAAAAELEVILAAAPAVTPHLVRAARPTTVKTRFTSGGHQLLRLDEEDAAPASAADAAALLAALGAALAGADVLVLSDYVKGVLSDAVLAGAIAAARAAGVPVVADPKRADFACYAGATVLTPNAHEVTAATNLPCGSDAEAEAAGQAARRVARAEAVLVTRAEKGVSLLREGAALHVPARARAVADVSGAGDTVTAVLAAALAAGASLEDAAGIANIAAGIVVGKPGTAMVGRAELAAALHRGELLAIDDKVADEATALTRIAAWKAAGLRVGFTNGCFDLIHPGHVRLLARARALCDRLVVALNTDASVARLKGPSRPVQNETARATVMAAIGSTDLVLLFDDDTPLRLITAALPDVLFKGADYTVATTVGADVVLASGGLVELIPLEDGHSTSATIRRIGSK